MRILIVTPIYPPEIGGPATYVSEIASRLIKLGHEIDVITFSHSLKTRKSSFVTYISTKGNFLSRQLRLFHAILLSSRTADIIYAQGTVVVGLASYLVSRILKRKLVVKFVGDEIWENLFNSGKTSVTLEEFYALKSKNVTLKMIVALHRFLLHHAPAIIVPSHYLKNFLIHNHDINPQRIHVISNAVEIDPQLVTRSSVLGTRSPAQYIVVGRLAKTKHVDLIIKAFIQANLKNAQLLIIGDGPEMPNLTLNIEPLKLDNIVFTGSLPEPEVSRYIAQSHCLILMSEYEGQSHTLIQALVCGTTIIASDIPPNRELLGDRGYLIPLSQEALSQTLNTIHHTHSRARRVPAEEYSFDTHIDKLKRLFQRV